MNRKKKILIIVSVVLIVIVSVVIYIIYKNKNTTYTWKTMPVKKGQVSILVKSTGTINADTTVQVGTQVTGIVWKLFADYNSLVKKGDIIAVLDTTFLSASRMDAQAALERSQAQLDQAQRDYDRNKELLKEKVIAQSDYETTLTALAVAKGAVTSAKAQLNHAKVNLQYAVIKAPVTGVVISRNVELGQTVVSSFNSVTLFSIANDLTKMQVQAVVDEADIGQIKVGQKATFTVDAYPEEVFKGEISQVRLEPITVQNVVNYIVIIEVANPELKLKPGLTANISIHVLEHDNVLKVPASALSFNPPAAYVAKLKNLPLWYKNEANKSNSEPGEENSGEYYKQKVDYIWVKQGNEIVPKKVTPILSDGNFTEVEGDITVGEEVVTGEVGKATALQTTRSPFLPRMPGGKR